MGRPLTTMVNLVLAGGGSACALVLVYFLYQYVWTGERVFTSWIGPLISYLLPASLCAFFFSSLRLNASFKARLALVTLSTTLSLYVAEVVLQALEPARTFWGASTKEEQQELVKIAARSGVTYDTRSQLQVVRDMRTKGLAVVPAVYPLGFYAPQPDGSLKSVFAIEGKEIAVLSGISNRPTVFCNESGDWVTYHSDEHGFHNPSGLWSSPNLDIVALGDSYAHGVCVPSDRGFVAVIRKRYPATLNLAMGGSGPLIALANLKEYAAKFRPRTVLWFLYEENDFGDLQKERKSVLLTRYLSGDFSQGLLDLQGDIDAALEDYLTPKINAAPLIVADDGTDEFALPAVLRLGSLRMRLGLVHGAFSNRGSVDRRVISEDTIGAWVDVLSEAKRTVSSWGGQIYLVYLPERERYALPRTAELADEIHETVLRMTRSLGVRVIDVHAAFRSHVDPLELFPFRVRGHYNEQGHRLVGETVLQALSAANVNPAVMSP
jgi:hypothetical protein